MSKIIPEDFRYSSDYNEFKTVIDSCSKLKEKGLFPLCFDFIKQIDIDISEENYKSLNCDFSYEDFKNILYNEVTYIIRSILYENDILDGMSEYLKEQYTELDETNINEIIELIDKKVKLVDMLLDEDDINRFYLKKENINRKISNIDYNIQSHLFEDNSECKYAKIEIKTTKKIANDNIPQQLLNLIETKDVKATSFMCDTYDLDILIKKLIEIKERLNG